MYNTFHASAGVLCNCHVPYNIIIQLVQMQVPKQKITIITQKLEERDIRSAELAVGVFGSGSGFVPSL